MKNTININTLNIREEQKEILRRLYAKRNGAFFKISFETFYGYNEKDMSKGVSAAWKGHVVSKITRTSVRKGINYNNVKAVIEKRAKQEGLQSSVYRPSFYHHIDRTLLKHNEKETYYIALFPNKGRARCSYKLDGRPISKEKLIELGVMQPSFWKNKESKIMFTPKLENIISID